MMFFSGRSFPGLNKRRFAAWLFRNWSRPVEDGSEAFQPFAHPLKEGFSSGKNGSFLSPI
jgi:hypothetical protein